MPAICENVRNWHNNAALSSWHTQSAWAGWFTLDLGASQSRANRGGARRDQMCPDTWKGTILNPRCPETNQPRVVPPLYDLNGNGVTALVTQPIPGAAVLHMIIADGKDDPRPFVGQLQSSGRMYSCDEFPPASWIEGGVGLGATAQSGTTYCAPWAYKCDDETDARGSEQNWQGFIHGFLGAHLEARLSADGKDFGRDYGEDNPIAFRFRYELLSPDVTWAARVVMDSGDTAYDRITPGTPFQRRSPSSGTRPVISFVPNGNGSMGIELSNGEVFRTHERGAERRALKRVRELVGRDVDQDDSNVSNKTESPQWYVFTIFIEMLNHLSFQAHYC